LKGIEGTSHDSETTWFGPWGVGWFAGDRDTAAKRFSFFFDSWYVEVVGAMADDWNGGLSFILPDFHMADRILNKVARKYLVTAA
jgi:hypothetical protein